MKQLGLASNLKDYVFVSHKGDEVFLIYSILQYILLPLFLTSHLELPLIL
jgi:hypothetical protein